MPSKKLSYLLKSNFDHAYNKRHSQFQNDDVFLPGLVDAVQVRDVRVVSAQHQHGGLVPRLRFCFLRLRSATAADVFGGKNFPS